MIFLEFQGDGKSEKKTWGSFVTVLYLMKPLDSAQIVNKMCPDFMSFPKIGKYKKGREIRK